MEDKNFISRNLKIIVKNKYENTKAVVEILYHYGVIGNEELILPKNSIGRSKVKTSFSYREDGNPDPDYGKRFIIHYALRKALNL